MLIATSIILTIFFLFLLYQVKIKLTGRTYLNDGWDIIRNDIEYQDYRLSEFHFPVTHIHDKFILTKVLPELDKNTTLSVLVDHSTIKVTVDNREVYQYGRDLFENNLLVGSGYHWITLPDDASGKKLTIELVATENNSFSSIKPLYYEPSNLVYQNFFLTQFPAFFTSIVLLGFGILLLIITIIMLLYNRNVIRLIYVATFSILITLWFGSNYRFLQLLGINYSLNTTIEYMALYMSMIPISLFFREVNCNNQTERKIFHCFVIESILFVVISFTLHGLNLVHLTQSLYLFHVALVIEVITILCSAIKAMKRKTQENRFILYGLLLLAFFVILDLIRFWFEKFASGVFSIQIRSFMPLGVIIFVISLLFSYLYFTFHNLTTKAENELLKKLAYTDILTGLSNRTRMDEYLETLNNKSNSDSLPFAMISMDLNRLKTINDTYGHETGDNYLKRFATLISSCFQKYGEVGRIGGDEFLVVLPNITRESSELLLSSLEKMLAEDNSTKPTNPLSFSYGICFSDELSNPTTKKIYRLADYRMYEMKKRYKDNQLRNEEEHGQDEYFN